MKLPGYEQKLQLVTPLAPVPKPPFRFTPMRDWMARPYSDPPWMLEGFVPSDARVIISGTPKKGKKTCMAMAMALALANGVTIGPFVPTGKFKVAFLEAEDTEPLLKERWRMMVAGLCPQVTDPYENIDFSHRDNILIDSAEGVAALREALSISDAKFFVIDTLARHMSGNENDVQGMSKILRNITDIVPKGMTVVLIHHTGKIDPKYDKDIDEALRGSSALSGAYDTHFAIRPPKNANDETPHTKLVVRGKAFDDKKYDLEWFFDNFNKKTTFTMIPTDKVKEITQSKIEMLSEMVSGFEYSLSRISELFGGISVNETVKLVSQLCSEGKLEETVKGFRLTSLKAVG